MASCQILLILVFFEDNFNYIYKVRTKIWTIIIETEVRDFGILRSFESNFDDLKA